MLEAKRHIEDAMRIHSAPPNRSKGAFSLVEIVVTLGLIGLVTAVAVPIYSNLHQSSEQAAAKDHVEALNRAVANFSHGCWKLPTAPNASATTDEFLVVRSLQYKFPAASLKPGSPFFDQTYDPETSSNSAHLRIRWNGLGFELIGRGQSGTGLRFNSGADYKKTPYSFPSGYKPEGAA
jgi:type II secretory pathway pseudopilin PulG